MRWPPEGAAGERPIRAPATASTRPRRSRASQPRRWPDRWSHERHSESRSRPLHARFRAPRRPVNAPRPSRPAQRAPAARILHPARTAPPNHRADEIAESVAWPRMQSTVRRALHALPHSSMIDSPPRSAVRRRTARPGDAPVAGPRHAQAAPILRGMQAAAARTRPPRSSTRE